MASTSSAPPMVFSQPNFSQLVSVKMDGSNYLNWVSQLLPILRSNGLLEFVDGTEPCPQQFTLDSDGRPEYALWHKKDHFVLGWLNATLSDKVLPSIFGITSAKQV